MQKNKSEKKFGSKMVYPTRAETDQLNPASWSLPTEGHLEWDLREQFLFFQTLNSWRARRVLGVGVGLDRGGGTGGLQKD